MSSLVYDGDYNKHWIELSLQFEKLAGNNNEGAVFCQERPKHRQSTEILLDSYPDTLSGYITSRWRDTFYEYSLPAPKTAFSNPPYVLSVRGVVNDTALPGLEVVWEEQTMSVRWKEMLTALFGEEE